MKKSQEGKDFYADLESKVATLLERTQSICRAQEATRQQLLDRWVWALDFIMNPAQPSLVDGGWPHFHACPLGS